MLADYVTLDTGTGVVHTAPGHGSDDFRTGVRYGLEIYAPVAGAPPRAPPLRLGGDVGCYGPTGASRASDRGASPSPPSRAPPAARPR